MKNSYVKWIGEIPDDWSVMSVKHFFNIERGRVISVFELCDDGEFPVYSSQTENNGCFGYLKTYDYSGPAITWTTDGAKAGTVFYREGKYNCTNVCGILTFKNDNEKTCNIKFMTYAIGMVAEQNKRKDINGYKIMSNEMAKIKFAVPPLLVQKAIATFLDKQCSEIDGLYSDIEKQIDVLEEYKKSMITEAVTKGLNPDVEMKDSGIEWMGMIPKHWNVNKIKYHLKRYEPRNPGDVQVLSVYRDYGVIPKDSRDDNHNVTSEDTSKYKYVIPGNLVINKMKAWQGSLAISDYEGIVSPAYFVYHFTDNLFNKKYFHYLIRTCYKDEFRRISGGIREGQWDLPAELFENELVPIPPIEEQNLIINYIQNKVSEIDKIITDKKEQLEVLSEYKKSVIYEYVTGKKEVPNG